MSTVVVKPLGTPVTHGTVTGPPVKELDRSVPPALKPSNPPSANPVTMGLGAGTGTK